MVLISKLLPRRCVGGVSVGVSAIVCSVQADGRGCADRILCVSNSQENCNFECRILIKVKFESDVIPYVGLRCHKKT